MAKVVIKTVKRKTTITRAAVRKAIQEVRREQHFKSAEEEQEAWNKGNAIRIVPDNYFKKVKNN